jgi:hypothetical protein
VAGRYWSGHRTWTGGRLWSGTSQSQPPPDAVAISTFAELKAAVASWLARGDLNDKIEDFITLAEARFNRRLRVRLMETEDDAFSIAAEEVSLPSGFRGVRDFFIPSGSVRYRLKYLSPETLRERYPSPSSTGIPRHYTMLGDFFVFGPIPDVTYTATLIYYTKFTPLSASNTTNNMLTNHPDLYLFTSLTRGEGYMQNDPRMAVWKQTEDEIVQEIKDEDKRDRVSGSALSPKANYGERGL